MPESNNVIKWSDIEAQLKNLRSIEGGFSLTRKGILTLPSAIEIFVKISLDDSTRVWTKKEIATYKYLAANKYPFIPIFLANNIDNSGLALEVLSAQSGWDWSNNWSKERVDKTLAAMDSLALIKPEADDLVFFSEKSIDEINSSWNMLSKSADRQQKLHDMLIAANRLDVANQIDSERATGFSRRFIFKNNSLVHYDVRADNCAWNNLTHQVRLVDWNWVQLGDRRIDVSSLMVHIYLSGFDILSEYTNRLDSDALHWLVGFWLNAATSPADTDNLRTLRQLQLTAGIAALDLLNQVE